MFARNPRDPKIDVFNLFTWVLGPGRYLDGFVPQFSSRYKHSDPKILILDPKSFKFYRNIGSSRPSRGSFDFPETIPAYLNFATAHIFFIYPKKLSYSSRNAYLKKIRVQELGEASSLFKNT